MKPWIGSLLILTLLALILIAPVVGGKTIDEIAAEQKVPIAEHVANFYNWAVGISALVALGILVYAGLAYTVAGGSASRQADAKTWISNAFIGLALLFGSYLILSTINPNLVKLQDIDLSQIRVGQGAGGGGNLDLSQLIANFYQWALGIGGLIALGILVFAGILYMVSPGNTSRQGDAKTWIFSALVGLLLLFGSYAILYTINPNLIHLFNLKEGLSSIDVGAPPGVPPGGEPPKPGEEVSVGIAEQIGNFYQWALGIGGLIALGVLVFAGVLYTASAGNASRQDDAKNWLLGAIIGLLLLFGSYIILYTINPELTKLEDLKLIVNKAAQTSISFVNNVVIDSKFKKAVADEIKKYDPKNVQGWMTLISLESSFDPNAKASSVSGQACGLFQTNCNCDGHDCGLGPWQTQVQNAMALFRERGPCYWDAADGVRNDGFNGKSILIVDFIPQPPWDKSCRWHY